MRRIIRAISGMINRWSLAPANGALRTRITGSGDENPLEIEVCFVLERKGAILGELKEIHSSQLLGHAL